MKTQQEQPGDIKELITEKITLENQVAKLSDELAIAHKERDALRERYANLVKITPPLSVVKGPDIKLAPLPTRDILVESLITSLKGTLFLDVDNLLIESVPLIKGGITGSEFARMISHANFADAGRIVTKLAPYLIYPLTTEDTKAILDPVHFSDQAGAAKALSRAQSKALQE